MTGRSFLWQCALLVFALWGGVPRPADAHARVCSSPEPGSGIRRLEAAGTDAALSHPWGGEPGHAMRENGVRLAGDVSRSPPGRDAQVPAADTGEPEGVSGGGGYVDMDRDGSGDRFVDEDGDGIDDRRWPRKQGRHGWSGHEQRGSGSAHGETGPGDSPGHHSGPGRGGR